jgi:dTDP-4-dehydrorhamnose reductase
MLFSRVLITGANGLLGQALVRQMSAWPEYDVLATARDRAPRYRDSSCGYLPLDITQAGDVRRAFLDFTPDVVINCAAVTQVDDCESSRELCWKVNVDAVETLAKNCLATGARLIQVSTDFVFDGEDGPYRESDRPEPVNFYGKSKLAAENMVRGAGLDQWAIARTVLVYGTAHGMTRSNIVLWIVDKLQKGEKIKVVTDQFRSPTYVEDLATGIERIVRFKKSGLYHLSGREYLSIYDFAQLVARTFDLDASLIEPTDRTAFSQNAERPPRTGFIILKAETELGFRPRSIPDALRHLGQQIGLSVEG